MAKTTLRPIRIVGDLAYIPLTCGFETVIDAVDVPLISGRNWYAAKVGKGGHVYALAFVIRNGVHSSERLHRVLLAAPVGMDVDHADMDTLNNRRSNIRLCTRTLNLANKAARRDSSTGIKGIIRHPSGRFRARLQVHGRVIHLGYFATAEEAGAAYEAKAKEIFGSFART